MSRLTKDKNILHSTIKWRHITSNFTSKFWSKLTIKLLSCPPRIKLDSVYGGRKTREPVGRPWSKATTNDKLNHLWHRARSEPQPCWWEESALTTEPSLLPGTCPVCPLIWNVLNVIKLVPTILLLQSFPVFSQVSFSFFPFSPSLFSLLFPVLSTRRNLD